jgi:hypothetical protein
VWLALAARVVVFALAVALVAFMRGFGTRTARWVLWGALAVAIAARVWATWSTVAAVLAHWA